jgi:hypothetical protein
MQEFIDTQGESMQAHACFTTTHGAEGPFPAPTKVRYERCDVTRTDPTGNAATAVGIFYITTSEDIGGATGQDVDLDANVGSDLGGLINVQKIANFVWRVQLYTVAGGGAGIFTLDDLMGSGNLGSKVNVTFRRVDPA